METLFDVIGVGVFIIGLFWAVITVGYFIAGFFIAKDSGFGKFGSVIGGLLLSLISGTWAAFLIWGGMQLWGVNP